jgi:hypothetical protein
MSAIVTVFTEDLKDPSVAPIVEILTAFNDGEEIHLVPCENGFEAKLEYYRLSFNHDIEVGGVDVEILMEEEDEY